MTEISKQKRFNFEIDENSNKIEQISHGTTTTTKRSNSQLRNVTVKQISNVLVYKTKPEMTEISKQKHLNFEIDENSNKIEQISHGTSTTTTEHSNSQLRNATVKNISNIYEDSNKKEQISHGTSPTKRSNSQLRNVTVKNISNVYKTKQEMTEISKQKCLNFEIDENSNKKEQISHGTSTTTEHSNSQLRNVTVRNISNIYKTKQEMTEISNIYKSKQEMTKISKQKYLNFEIDENSNKKEQISNGTSPTTKTTTVKKISNIFENSNKKEQISHGTSPTTKRKTTTTVKKISNIHEISNVLNREIRSDKGMMVEGLIKELRNRNQIGNKLSGDLISFEDYKNLKLENAIVPDFIIWLPCEEAVRDHENCSFGENLNLIEQKFKTEMCLRNAYLINAEFISGKKLIKNGEIIQQKTPKKLIFIPLINDVTYHPDGRKGQLQGQLSFTIPNFTLGYKSFGDLKFSNVPDNSMTLIIDNKAENIYLGMRIENGNLTDVGIYYQCVHHLNFTNLTITVESDDVCKVNRDTKYYYGEVEEIVYPNRIFYNVTFDNIKCPKHDPVNRKYTGVNLTNVTKFTNYYTVQKYHVPQWTQSPKVNITNAHIENVLKIGDTFNGYVPVLIDNGIHCSNVCVKNITIPKHIEFPIGTEFIVDIDNTNIVNCSNITEGVLTSITSVPEWPKAPKVNITNITIGNVVKIGDKFNGHIPKLEYNGITCSNVCVKNITIPKHIEFPIGTEFIVDIDDTNIANCSNITEGVLSNIKRVPQWTKSPKVNITNTRVINVVKIGDKFSGYVPVLMYNGITCRNVCVKNITIPKHIIFPSGTEFIVDIDDTNIVNCSNITEGVLTHITQVPEWTQLPKVNITNITIENVLKIGDKFSGYVPVLIDNGIACTNVSVKNIKIPNHINFPIGTEFIVDIDDTNIVNCSNITDGILTRIAVLSERPKKVNIANAKMNLTSNNGKITGFIPNLSYDGINCTNVWVANVTKAKNIGNQFLVDIDNTNIVNCSNITESVLTRVTRVPEESKPPKVNITNTRVVNVVKIGDKFSGCIPLLMYNGITCTNVCVKNITIPKHITFPIGTEFIVDIDNTNIVNCSNITEGVLTSITSVPEWPKAPKVNITNTRIINVVKIGDKFNGCIPILEYNGITCSNVCVKNITIPKHIQFPIGTEFIVDIDNTNIVNCSNITEGVLSHITRVRESPKVNITNTRIINVVKIGDKFNGCIPLLMYNGITCTNVCVKNITIPKHINFPIGTEFIVDIDNTNIVNCSNITEGVLSHITSVIKSPKKVKITNAKMNLTSDNCKITGFIPNLSYDGINCTNVWVANVTKAKNIGKIIGNQFLVDIDNTNIVNCSNITDGILTNITIVPEWPRKVNVIDDKMNLTSSNGKITGFIPNVWVPNVTKAKNIGKIIGKIIGNQLLANIFNITNGIFTNITRIPEWTKITSAKIRSSKKVVVSQFKKYTQSYIDLHNKTVEFDNRVGIYKDLHVNQQWACPVIKDEHYDGICSCDEENGITNSIQCLNKSLVKYPKIISFSCPSSTTIECLNPKLTSFKYNFDCITTAICIDLTPFCTNRDDIRFSSFAKMVVVWKSSSYCFIFLVILNVIVPSLSRIHTLKLKNDSRNYITMSTFGFYKNGALEVFLKSFTFDPYGPNQVFGFSLEKTITDATSAYLQDHQDKCMLESTRLQDDNTMAFILFTMDRKNKILIVNCSQHLQGIHIYANHTMYANDKQQMWRMRAARDITSDVYLMLPRESTSRKYRSVNTSTSTSTTSTSTSEANDNIKTSTNSTNNNNKEQENVVVDGKSSSSSSCEVVNIPIMETKKDGVPEFSVNFLVAITQQEEEGLYNLNFHNCPNYEDGGRTAVNLTVTITETNNNDNFLSAGEMPLPALYFTMSVLFFLSGGFWVFILKKCKGDVFKIHYVMAVLVYLKSLNLLFHGIHYHFIQTSGIHIESWAILDYVTHLLKGALMFTTIVLIGTGWAFIKHVLSDKDKKIFMIVIPLQILDNVAAIIMEESEEGDSAYFTWKDVFILVDLLCCGAILFPVIWSIRHLQDASQTDGKAVTNLRKLKLFRHFYIMIVCYIYFSRIIVHLLKITVPFQYEWLDEMFYEMAAFVFYVLTGYKFRPKSNNPYFQVPQEDYDLESDQVIIYSGVAVGLKKVNQHKTDNEEEEISNRRESSLEYD
ncbi:hypothetical protein CHUAL_006055 [Chamberlinius hualienensis]